MSGEHRHASPAARPAPLPMILHTAPAGLRSEEERFDLHCRGGAETPRLMLWSQSRCLVTTPSIARAPIFQDAAARSALAGWPVHLRRSGGTTVFHAPDVLCVTVMFHGQSNDLSIDQAYRRFTAILTAALAGVGLEAKTGYAPQAPCDGRFNILVEGRKLAGTAMRHRTVAGRTYLLGHAAILTGAGFAEGLAAVEAFEHHVGFIGRYPAGASISLDALIGASAAEQIACSLGRVMRSVSAKSIQQRRRTRGRTDTSFPDTLRNWLGRPAR